MGTGCTTGFLQKSFYTVIFLGLTHSTSLEGPNTPSSIIDFPFSLFLGKDFSVEPEGFPCQRLPPPSSLCIPRHPWGSELQWDTSASNSWKSTKREIDWVIHHVLDVEALWKHSYLKPSFMTQRTLGVLGRRDPCPSLPLLWGGF